MLQDVVTMRSPNGITVKKGGRGKKYDLRAHGYPAGTNGNVSLHV